MRLAELQAQFARALLERDAGALLPMIVTDGIAPEERLEIYHVNVTENLIDAVQDAYPAVCALVGEAFFRQMTRQFVIAFPPDAACLLWYGGALPDYIQHYEAASSVPYLADVARFEWALHVARYAEDEVALDTQWLECQPEEVLAALTLALRHGVGLIVSIYPLRAIHAYALDPEHEMLPDLNAGAETLAIWRNEREVHIATLCDATLQALRALGCHCTIEAAVAAAQATRPEVDGAELLGKILAMLIVSQPATFAERVGL